MTAAQDITHALTESDGRPTRDWGIAPNEQVDERFRSELEKIREAELEAERNATSLRVC